MDETMLGTCPSTPMTLTQRLAHKRLARAEQRYILCLVWDKPPAVTERAYERSVRRTVEWKAACHV